MRLLCMLCACMLLCNTATAQNKFIKTYYNSRWELTTQPLASYVRVGFIDTTSYHFNGEVKDYYVETSSLQMKGTYIDNIKEGVFSFYYPNGTLMAKGLYEGNARVGIWEFFYENGMLKDRLVFYKVFITVLDAFDKEGNATVRNGTGNWDSEYYNDFSNETFKVQGTVKDTLMQGEWKFYGYDRATKRSSVLRCRETYENSVFKSGKHYFGSTSQKLSAPKMDIYAEYVKFRKTEVWSKTEQASVDEYPLLTFLPKINYTLMPVNSLARMPKGDNGIHELGRRIRFTEEFLESQKHNVTIFLKLLIDEHGNMSVTSNYKSTIERNPEYKEVYEALVKALYSLPKWEPATRDGKNVESMFTILLDLDIAKNSVRLALKNENSLLE